MNEEPGIDEYSPAGDVLHSLLEAIREPVGEEEVLTSFVRRLLVDTPHAGRVCVWAAGADAGAAAPVLDLVASARPPGAVIHQEWTLEGAAIDRLPLTEPLIGRTVADGEPRWARDELAWPTYPDWARRDGIFAYYATPILADASGADTTFGALAVFHRYRFLDPQMHDREIRRTRLRADLLGTAILRARQAAAERAWHDRRAREVVNIRLARAAAAGYDAFLGSSAAARRVREQVALGARTGAAVLVRGEPGTGRTLVAHTIIAGGDRHNQPRAELDAAVVAPRDLAAELAGCHDVARGGTLLIRHVDRLPPGGQLALLEHLERADDAGEPVQVIATTAPGIRNAVETGRFDPDLWNRLGVVLIDVPPLRDHPDDIPDLAIRFAATAARRCGRPPLQPTPSQLRALAGHTWPGNVRELAAVIEQATLTARGHRLNIESLVAGLAAGTIGGDAAAGDGSDENGPIRTEAEMRALLRANTLAALRCANWIVSGPDGAASRLGIKPTTLAARMQAMGIERPR